MPSWRAVVKRYREVLQAPLEKDRGRDGDTSGSLSEAEALGGSVRQVTDGVAVGLPPFLERVFGLARECFGPRRQTGARRMRGIESELRAMRDLQSTSC